MARVAEMWRRWPGAACQDHEPNLMFPVGYMKADMARAREVCERCPVARDCLDEALSDPTLQGVWAGTTPRQRETMRGEDWDAIFAEGSRP